LAFDPCLWKQVFRDQVKVFVFAGSGGAGSLHFRREKFVPMGGPDGGDGGRGGSVYAVADPNVNTLWHYIHHRHHRAEPGGNGTLRRRHGSAGEDLLLKVPVGTVIHDADSGDVLADLSEPGQRVMVARGGRGGLGNTHFATATYQAPRIAEKGEPGVERAILLELKLIADVGIAGLPNAGKSTLLAQITAARPKIADYPFTTLTPNLGVVVSDDYSFVVADIPGLIEGAHEGLGLGHEFLRHVERTSVLIHMVDGSDGGADDILAHIDVIDNELALYSADLAQRPQVIGVNKMDLPHARETWPAVEAALSTRGLTAFPISAVTGEGVGALVRRVRQLLETERARQAGLAPEPETVVIPPRMDVLKIDVLKGGAFRVHSRSAERAMAMTDTNSEEALNRLQALLRRFGVTRALERAGVTDGATVYIGGAELVWGDIADEPSSRRLTRAERIARRDSR
jgi:GTP-binding protein